MTEIESPEIIDASARSNNSDGVAKWRLIALRIFYGIIFVLLGKDAWPQILTRGEAWLPLSGVAFSFWAAFSALSILGLRYPLKMLPLLLLQMLYKITWLLGVGLPLWRAGKWDSGVEELFIVCAVGVTIDLFVIPWRYVLQTYVLKSSN